MKRIENKEFHVAISYSGTDRGYVEQVVSYLESQGVKLFFDRNEEASLAGKRLDEFKDIYSNRADRVIIFLSAEYQKSDFTKLEREAAELTAKAEDSGYIITVKLDDSKVEGFFSTLVFVDARGRDPLAIAKVLRLNLSNCLQFKNFIPPNIDNFFSCNPQILAGQNIEEKKRIEDVLRIMIYGSLEHMNENERIVIALAVINRCSRYSDETIRIDIGYLTRLTNNSRSQLLEIFKNLASFNFVSEIHRNTPNKIEDDQYVSEEFVEFKYNAHKFKDYSNGTNVLKALYNTFISYCCENCMLNGIKNNDLSILSSECKSTIIKSKEIA